jgi:hypothetical protein
VFTRAAAVKPGLACAVCVVSCAVCRV